MFRMREKKSSTSELHLTQTEAMFLSLLYYLSLSFSLLICILHCFLTQSLDLYPTIHFWKTTRYVSFFYLYIYIYIYREKLCFFNVHVSIRYDCVFCLFYIICNCVSAHFYIGEL